MQTAVATHTSELYNTPKGEVKHFLASNDLTSEQIRLVLDVAKAMKWQRKHLAQQITPIEGRLCAMIFEKPSLRTRVSFETAMHELGGHATYLTKNDIDMGHRESVADVAQVLSRWATIIVARLFSHKVICDFAAHSNVPVINALTDEEHPCQALADLLTIEEVFGKGPLKVAYVGDGNNVANSFAVTAAKLGHEVILCTPPGYEASSIAYSLANVKQEYNPSIALADADVVYTDVWTSMGQESESELREKRFANYQVNEALMSRAASHAIFLHCLPAHRGLEVTDAVIDGPQSKVFDQSENRLHAQKALMKLMLENEL